MKVIDILTEGVAGEASERVLKSILGHSTWSAAQKIAFKDSVDLCTDAIEKMLLRGQDLNSPAATKEAWFAIQPRLQGTPWATRDFVQEVFTVSKAEAEERVAAKAGALKPKEPETPKPKDEPKAKDSDKSVKQTWGELSKWGKFDRILKWTFWGSNAGAVAQAVNEYNEQRALAEKVMRGEYIDPDTGQPRKPFTPQELDTFARGAHVRLISTLAPLVVIPVTMKGFLATMRFFASVLQKLLPSVSNWIMGSIVKPIEKILSIAQKEIKPNSKEWTEKMSSLMSRGYTKEEAAQMLADISKYATSINRTFNTVATGFAAALANPQKIWTDPKTKEEYSLMEIVMAAALEVPFFSPIMSTVSEIVFNLFTKIWNNLGGQAITGWEATTFQTDLERAGSQGPAQKQAQQPAASTPANQGNRKGDSWDTHGAQPIPAQTPKKSNTRPDGVEVINWD